MADAIRLVDDVTEAAEIILDEADRTLAVDRRPGG
jgi:hypothetical protein